MICQVRARLTTASIVPLIKSASLDLTTHTALSLVSSEPDRLKVFKARAKLELPLVGRDNLFQLVFRYNILHADLVSIFDRSQSVSFLAILFNSTATLTLPQSLRAASVSGWPLLRVITDRHFSVIV